MALARRTDGSTTALPAEVRDRVREPGGPWVGLAAAVFYPLTLLLARRRMEGLEHVPATGAALLVCNHVSYLDPVYTAVFVHRARRVPRFMAKNTLWDVPVLGRVLAGSRQIPVTRGSREAGDSLAAAGRSIDRDDGVVVIYPEGTITRDPEGWPGDARSGAARLALEHDVPVVPTVHWGTLAVYDHYRRRFRPSWFRTVTVRAGAPVDLSDLRARIGPTGRPGAADLREATERIMGAVRALLEDVRAGAPDGGRRGG